MSSQLSAQPGSAHPQPAASTTASERPDARLRRHWLTETWLVLGVSLGASGIWSALSLLRTWIEAMAAGQSLSSRSSSLNASASAVQWLDLIYQLVGIALALVPVALALHLLAGDGLLSGPRAAARESRPTPWRTVLSALGIDGAQPKRDALRGAALTALIGIPGLGLYLLARQLGFNTTVVASGLGDHWWTLPVLVLSAAQNAVLEEVIMIGYLFRRWAQAGWGTVRIMILSALIRGSYHLYQGLGGFAGNVIMGLIFGYFYTRTKRVLPLIITHTLLDVFAFVGYALLHGKVSWL